MYMNKNFNFIIIISLFYITFALNKTLTQDKCEFHSYLTSKRHLLHLWSRL